jgi:hypothetical protein
VYPSGWDRYIGSGFIGPGFIGLDAKILRPYKQMFRYKRNIIPPQKEYRFTSKGISFCLKRNIVLFERQHPYKNGVSPHEKTAFSPLYIRVLKKCLHPSTDVLKGR